MLKKEIRIGALALLDCRWTPDGPTIRERVDHIGRGTMRTEANHAEGETMIEKPIPIYTVTYRGEALFMEARARNALARIPEDARGWKILCHLGEGEGPRIVLDGNRPLAARKEKAA